MKQAKRRDRAPGHSAPPAELPRAPADPRFERLDLLRGGAIVWMMAFHLFFDLNHFGLLTPKQNFYADPFWTWQRTAIVSSFLFCAGLSLACALNAGRSWPRFWRRVLQVAGCAVLVSAGSALMFPKSWISFGVLHGIAVMLLLVQLLATRERPVWLWWALGACALLLPWFFSHPWFDSRWTNPIGLVTRKPVTEDYVPLLPWLGVLFWGLAVGQSLLARGSRLLTGRVPVALGPITFLGRWPLSAYMLHQPIFIGLIWLATTITQ